MDVYDAIRRMAALLKAYRDPTSVERLYITDFYLANPPLLHQTNMSSETRSSFRKLSIPRPNKTFLTYPASQLLYKKMEQIQKEALQALRGKGLLSFVQHQKGRVQLTIEGESVFDQILLEQLTMDESDLVQFLSLEFAPIYDMDEDKLRKKTGLRRGRW